MGNLITINNETWWSSNQQEIESSKLANFDFFVKYSGKVIVGFKGIMSEGYGSIDCRYCIVKVFRDASTETSSTFCRNYSKRNLQIKKLENEYKKLFGGSFAFQKCYVAEMDLVSVFNQSFRRTFGNRKRKLFSGEWVVFESLIPGQFQTFVDANGSIGAGCPEVLQTFCHFIYHQSEGNIFATKIKGVLKKDGQIYLTTPSFVSKQQQQEENRQCAVENFFLQHECNSICQSWLRPTNNVSKVFASNAMVHPVFTYSIPVNPPPYCQEDYEQNFLCESLMTQLLGPPPCYEAKLSLPGKQT